MWQPEPNWLAVGSGGVRTEPSLARTATAMSWIWFVGGNVDAREIHDAVRVQWSKAMARRDRWTEEVELLREEMKRVLRSLAKLQAIWLARAEMREVDDPSLVGGLRAYALRQVAMYKEISAAFYARWNLSAAQAVRIVVEEEN
ncbi:hypothetical protein MIND_01302600 [Mycena indigotica]|uniref:Uncharacterized protein n=1 Tax=Mycena indigotica TaxID=2126181 RepID=A0A8H6VR34_9AGAR|nr:uncharacterized protein MIND_01302600 [Mycena indigotica]KAF7290624.1 hypothetical protein MIND_01302600 [Mycena indigotica]